MQNWPHVEPGVEREAGPGRGAHGPYGYCLCRYGVYSYGLGWERDLGEACTAYAVMAYIVMAYIVMAYVVMAYVVMAYIVMAHVVMVHVVMAYVVMDQVILVSAALGSLEGDIDLCHAGTPLFQSALSSSWP